jgi:hypothetical protein
MPVSEDHFTDHLANVIHEDLFETWRENTDDRITSFCPCSETLSGACSVKNRSRAKRSHSRSCRRTTQGKSADPDGDGPSPGPQHNLAKRRRSS